MLLYGWKSQNYICFLCLSKRKTFNLFILIHGKLTNLHIFSFNSVQTSSNSLELNCTGSMCHLMKYYIKIIVSYVLSNYLLNLLDEISLISLIKIQFSFSYSLKRFVKKGFKPCLFSHISQMC